MRPVAAVKLYLRFAACCEAGVDGVVDGAAESVSIQPCCHSRAT